MKTQIITSIMNIFKTNTQFEDILKTLASSQCLGMTQFETIFVMSSEKLFILTMSC